MEGEMMANAELAIAVTNAPQEPEPMQMDMPEESIEETQEETQEEQVQESAYRFWGTK
jgi:hypothetical protein